MQVIHTLSLAPDVKDWLANSGHPRILHVFDQACNLINEYREVLSIVTPQIGNGPFNLVVADDIIFSDYLSLESFVSISPTQLTIGSLIIHLTNAKLWNPRPDWETLHAGKGEIGNQLTQLSITNHLNFDDFDTRLTAGSRFLHHRGLQLPQSLVSNLSSSLTAADLHSSLTAVRKLAGLGAGLTPSGDDLIIGVIYATWIIHPFEIARILAREVADTAAPLTTSLSAAWLRSAGTGEAGILWHRLFDALLVNRTLAPHASAGVANPTYLQEPIKNILAVGETSGADALTGFTAVFAAWMEKAGSSDA